MFIAVFMTAAAYALFNMVLKEVYKVENNIARMGNKVEMRNLIENSCVQHNSFTNSLNNLSCLGLKNCTTGMTGDLKIFSDKVSLINDPGVTPFDANLYPCGATAENCKHRLKSTYRVVCSSTDCKTPDILLQFKFYKPGATPEPDVVVEAFDISLTYQHVYKTCHEAFSDGNTASDTFMIDPDGNGGICPFKVYCDMSPSLGTARTLIGRASVAPYSELPYLAPPIEMQSQGLMAAEYVQALMASPEMSKKVSVDIEDSLQGNLTTSLQLASATLGLGTGPISYCEQNNRNFHSATNSGSGVWKLGAENGSSFVGFSAEVVASKMVGFSCGNCAADYSCNLGATSCCQSQLKGSIWLE